MSTTLYSRKAAVLLKLEGGTPGVDANPTPGSNALLVSDLSINPLEVQTVSLDYIRAYYGASPSIIVSQNASVSFTIDLAGAKTAGTAPPWTDALKACGFMLDTSATAVTGTATAGTATTITLAVGSSSTSGYYVGAKISWTSGGVNFGSGVIVKYDGATRVATVVGMTGTPSAASAYSIEAFNKFQPLTDSSPTCTIYYYASGIKHVMLGCRGSMSLELSANARPQMKFSFIGIYSPVTNAAVPATTLTSWAIPPAVITENISGYFLGKALSGGASGLQLAKFALDIASDNQFVQRVGSSGVAFTGRSPKGSVSFEMPLVNELDVFSYIQNNTTGSVNIRSGTTAGNIINIVLPDAQLQTPKYSDDKGVMMLDADILPLPINGNDELFITIT
jgi:hypothetical protein